MYLTVHKSSARSATKFSDFLKTHVIVFLAEKMENDNQVCSFIFGIFLITLSGVFVEIYVLTSAICESSLQRWHGIVQVQFPRSSEKAIEQQGESC